MNKYWTHKKYGPTKFKGSYQRFILRDGTKERVFLLEGENVKGKRHVISFESWQAAKRAEWSKA